MLLPNLRKIVISIFSFSLLLCFLAFSSYASDFIAPNSSGEPIVVDISNLNTTSSIDVSVGEFADQPRPYRNTDTKLFVVFPPPVPSSEKTLQIQSGSSVVTKTISFRAAPSGNLKSSLLSSLKEGRAGNSVTKISDGRIVLIGGSKALAEDPINSIEVFNPENGKTEFLKTPDELKKSSLRIPRSQHSAIYIGISNTPVGMIAPPVEQILVTGGFSKDSKIENTIEIVEIKVGSFQSTSTLLISKKSKLKKGRIFHTLSLLPDGRVLIIGGQGRINKTNLGALNSIEIFDPLTKLVQPLETSLKTPRLLHTATTLQDGNILITGGFTNEKQDEFGFGPGTQESEIIDNSNLTIKKAGALKEAVGGHTATLLTNGNVLILGGSTDFFSSRTKDEFKGISKSTIQFYDKNSETFNLVAKKSGGNIELEIPRFLHQSVLLPNGNVAVIGGLNIKATSNSTNILSTPVSTIEVLEPDLQSSSLNTLKAEKKSNLDTFTGRILPSAILVTPKNKTQGFLSSIDQNTFVNCAIYLTGGFTNGFGKLPSKISEFIQIESNNSIEGRQIKTTPEVLIQGSYLGEYLVELDKFVKVPSIKAEPQTVNLSSSNNFMANIKVLTTNSQVILLKSENPDSNNSIIISPTLFQAGETVSISRKDNSVSRDFEINIVPFNTSDDFLNANVKVHVQDSSKPFLSTVPPHGISLSNQEGNNSEKVQLKVFTQDGSSELSSLPSSTQVTATILDPTIANLGGSGISSITGTLATTYSINALKPGKTTVNFSLNSQDILPVSIPIKINGTPTFSNNPIDSSNLSNLTSNGIGFSKASKISSTIVSLEDLRITTNTSLFPTYVPINLQSSIDSSNITGLFTIRPVFGVDLLTAIPRTLVNNSESDFRVSLTTSPKSISGIVPKSFPSGPLAILASDDGIRSISFSGDPESNIKEPFEKISVVSNLKPIKLFEIESSKVLKIAALKGEKFLVIDANSGDVESSVNLSDAGFELKLTKIDNQIASVIPVGNKGIDLVFPITDDQPRIVNFRPLGNTKTISLIDKLQDKAGPFAIAYDSSSIISIVNLINVDEPIQTIDTNGGEISKIDYAGKFTVNGQITDVLIAATQREVLLFDLNKKTSIPVNEDLKIKSEIEDLIVIDGIAYLALGQDGILALSIGSLLDKNKDTDPIIAQFKKNKLIVIKPSGKQEILTKLLNSKILANSKPFLLSSGDDNNLTVIKVSP